MDLLDVFKNIIFATAKILYEIFTLDYSLLESQVFFAVIGTIIVFYVIKTIALEILVFPVRLIKQLFIHLAIFLAKKIGFLLQILFGWFRQRVNSSASAATWEKVFSGLERGKDFFLKIWYEAQNK